MLTITRLFELLGAPLKNNRWSWGAVRNDGSVVLRVWRTEIYETEDDDWVIIDRNNDNNCNGKIERKKHISLIQKGAPCYAIICKGHEEKKIVDFDKDNLWVIDRIKEIEGDVCGHIQGKLPINNLAA